MPRAILLLREKVVDAHGNLLEVVVWRVAASPGSPSGVRYRLALVLRGEDKPVVLYDNHPPKGHHRHVEGVEAPYAFVDVDRLLADFRSDVERLGGGD